MFFFNLGTTGGCSKVFVLLEYAMQVRKGEMRRIATWPIKGEPELAQRAREKGNNMCFRPAAVEIDKTCTECGAKAPASETVCPECGAELPAGPAMPAAPGMPGAPGAPAAPGRPGAPAAPKAPGQN